MKISSLSIPKDRTNLTANDDTVLLMPNVYGVFDGATSVTKGAKSNISSGQLASQSAASVVAKLVGKHNFRAITPEIIFGEISAEIQKNSRAMGIEGKASTTMSLAAICEDELRILVIGDSGVRINGERVIWQKKLIDDISTSTRIAVFELLSTSHNDTNVVEKLTRQVSFGGFADAIAQDVLTKTQADTITKTVKSEFASQLRLESIDTFLEQGIRSQYMYANNSESVLGYSALNEDKATLDQIIDLRIPLSEINSIEIFSDGYFQIPDEVSIDAWEDEFQKTEQDDFHKTGKYANVKGSTSTEFSDDRSVVVIERNSN